MLAATRQAVILLLMVVTSCLRNGIRYKDGSGYDCMTQDRGKRQIHTTLLLLTSHEHHPQRLPLGSKHTHDLKDHHPRRSTYPLSFLPPLLPPDHTIHMIAATPLPSYSPNGTKLRPHTSNHDSHHSRPSYPPPPYRPMTSLHR